MLNGTSGIVQTNMKNFLTEVQYMVDGTSNKFVPALEIEEILEDLLVELNASRIQHDGKNFGATKYKIKHQKNQVNFM